jgi:hypothetical protein
MESKFFENKDLELLRKNYVLTIQLLMEIFIKSSRKLVLKRV